MDVWIQKAQMNTSVKGQIAVTTAVIITIILIVIIAVVILAMNN